MLNMSDKRDAYKDLWGPCSNCGKQVRSKKLWCSLKCQIEWERKEKRKARWRRITS